MVLRLDLDPLIADIVDGDLLVGVPLEVQLDTRTPGAFAIRTFANQLAAGRRAVTDAVHLVVLDVHVVMDLTPEIGVAEGNHGLRAAVLRLEVLHLDTHHAEVQGNGVIAIQGGILVVLDREAGLVGRAFLGGIETHREGGLVLTVGEVGFTQGEDTFLGIGGLDRNGDSAGSVGTLQGNIHAGILDRAIDMGAAGRLRGEIHPVATGNVRITRLMGLLDFLAGRHRENGCSNPSEIFDKLFHTGICLN